MKKLSIEQFQQEIKSQGMSNRLDVAFKCPMCKTIQSMRSFTAAGVDEYTAELMIGFSCVGRFTGAPGPRKEPDGQPCNWTLGGLFKTHEMEVVDSNGKVHLYFDLATPEQAKALEVK
jgi:hypothetical protein